MAREHTYELVVSWSGNRGTGTSSRGGYGREHEVTADGPPAISGSADPAFGGDPARWNPEQLLVAALSQCHMLWYLHLCATAGVVVTSYVDRPCGLMTETGDGGRFTDVVLRPHVTVTAPDMVHKAIELHAAAHRSCFVANSVSVPVRHDPTVQVVAGDEQSDGGAADLLTR